MSADEFFDDAFGPLTGTPGPFPWQRELFRRFLGDLKQWPPTCDFPTGVGKTWVIAIWLLALAWSARDRTDANAAPRLPRRLIYIVNRRTVVDQATDEEKKRSRRVLLIY